LQQNVSNIPIFTEKWSRSMKFVCVYLVTYHCCLLMYREL